MLLTYIAIQLAVISGWSGFSGSMGPKEHTKDLSLVVGAWYMLGGSKAVAGEGHFWSKIPMSEKNSVAPSWPPMPPKLFFSGWNGLYGSMGPWGCVRHLGLVMGPFQVLNRTQMVAGECHFSPKSPYLGGGSTT